MGLFTSFTRNNESEENLKAALVEIAAFGAGDESAQEKANMDKVLTRVEGQLTSNSNSMLFYWL